MKQTTWREPLDKGIWKNHVRACPSSRDHRPGRRCHCKIQLLAPGMGRTRTVTMPEGTTLTEAKQERRRLQAAGRPMEPAAPAGPDTLHELALSYFRAKEPILAPSTIWTTAGSYRLYVAPALATADPRTITRPQVEVLVGSLLSAGHSTHAARKAVAALRVILSFAVQGGVLERNVAFGVQVAEPPRDPDAPPPVERVLDLSELTALLAACETRREEVIIRLGAESGLRRGEVRGLRWPDLDLAARRITVRRSVWREVVKLPKGKRPRRIAITPELAEALAALWEEEVIGQGRDATGWVLPGRDGTSPLSDDTPLEVVQQVQKRAGLVVKVTNQKGKVVTRPKVTFHELRHTAATMMLTGGKSAVVVAKQLGHRDSRITTQVYEHLLDDGLLDDALGVFSDRKAAAGAAADLEVEAGVVASPDE